MTQDIDHELLNQLIENDANKAPGTSLKPAAWKYFVKRFFDGDSVKTHTPEPVLDTKICCPDCTQLCDIAMCWCGASRELHETVWHNHHFIPKGCGCTLAEYLRGRPVPKTPEIEMEHPWDIL